MRSLKYVFMGAVVGGAASVLLYLLLLWVLL